MLGQLELEVASRLILFLFGDYRTGMFCVGGLSYGERDAGLPSGAPKATRLVQMWSLGFIIAAVCVGEFKNVPS